MGRRRPFQIPKMAGYTVSSSRNDVTRPPIIGAAIRFMTSAPVPVLQRTGHQTDDHRRDGHELRTEALRRALDDALA